ncbi:MAG: DnaJ domain-containing protein [Magnetococcales bacterium]|nr:DnaJ domain-containing protein [Magnetococcales bacterium]
MDPSQFKDYYKILGVPPSAGQGEIKKIFRKLAREYHPDINKNPDSEVRFKEISAAYDILGDEEKRREYDTLYQYMQNPGSRSRPQGKAGGASGQGFSFDFSAGSSPDIEEIFNRFFGQTAGNNPFARSRSGGFPFFGNPNFSGSTGHRCGSQAGHNPEPRPAKPDAQVEISLEEAFQGCKRSLEWRTPQGVKQIVVTLPAGITDGQTIRIGGGPNKQEPERLITVKISPHRWFRLNERDCELDLPLTPWEAALGCQLTVPTLGGQVRLRIPPGSQSGQRLSLKGKGLPGNPPGNQTVLLRIVTPGANTAHEIEAYQRFAKEFTFNPRPEQWG